jgi:hypothetical protein
MSAQDINAFGKAIFGRLPFCAIPGAFVGVVVGAFMSLVQILHPVHLTGAQVFITGLGFGLIGFASILAILALFFHYGLAAIFWPTLVNTLIVGILVVAVLNVVQFPPIGALLGFIIGMIVGSLLCAAACRYLRREAHAS